MMPIDPVSSTISKIKDSGAITGTTNYSDAIVTNNHALREKLTVRLVPGGVRDVC